MAETADLLKSALTSLLTKLEQTEKFVLEQAPDICQQIVTEFKLQNFTQMILSAISIIFGAVAIPISYSHDLITKVSEWHSGDPTWWLGLFIVGILAAGIGSITLGNSIYYLVYVSKCPKLFLLRELRRLI